ncbi:MAG: HigA family addiction module antidote protein [Thermomicrobiales bacterium]|jgi:addiction module HigA family antidote|nr:HigA family addiction module antidote protein [Thermomicrobiales bacterium]
MMFDPAHPGRIVKGALDDLGLSVTDAAQVLNVARPTLSKVINGRAGISAEMAVRLSKTIGSTPEFWMRLQMNYELAQVERNADAIVVNPLPQARSLASAHS